MRLRSALTSCLFYVKFLFSAAVTAVHTSVSYQCSIGAANSIRLEVTSSGKDEIVHLSCAGFLFFKCYFSLVL